jgi:hypothetical protein
MIHDVLQEGLLLVLIVTGLFNLFFLYGKCFFLLTNLWKMLTCAFLYKSEHLSVVYKHAVFLFRCIKGEPTIEEYYDLYVEAEVYNNQISEAILLSPNAQQFLNTGRVVVIKSESVSS